MARRTSAPPSLLVSAVLGAALATAACSVPSVPSPLSCVDDTGCPADAHCRAATCSADRPPRAAIVGPRTAAVGGAITFDGSASSDGDDEIVSWTWSVRVLSAACAPELGSGSAGSFQPVFGCPGEFEVILVVRDRTGVLSDPAVAPVTITAS